MRQFILCLLLGIYALSAYSQPCNTDNASGCICEDSSSVCDLLPDINISWFAIKNHANGPSEYPQVCNPPCSGNDARLRVTGSTPNIGYGPLTVLGSNFYICGTDTFESAGTPGNCANGTPPRNLIKQRVYQKDGNLMTYYDRWSGAMTYHPTHNHNHVDDWCIFTLRIKNENKSDPRKWDIVGKGSKIGFCLMDYGSCSAFSGHCRDDNTTYLGGEILTNASFPNYGLGGGEYNCSPVIQGISSGFTDIYSKSLDMMWIDIPPNICNGEYWIVVEVDPLNHFLESNDENNYTAVPFTLTRQSQPGNPVAKIYANKPNQICFGDSIMLTAKAGIKYLWSTGDSTQSIVVKTPGTYEVTITDYCGTATSSPFNVTVAGLNVTPFTLGDTLCGSGSATLYAEGEPELIKWYNQANNGNLLFVGNNFQTPTLHETTTYYVQTSSEVQGSNYKIGPESSNICEGNYSSTGQSLIFDVESPFRLKSVLVDANSLGSRTFIIKNEFQAVLASKTVLVPAGISRVELDFDIPVGENFTFEANANPGLYRNRDCSTFPYEVPGVVSIKNSSAGNLFYYYFYDWEIQLPNSICAGERTPVTAIVNVIEEGFFTEMPDTVDVTDSAIILNALPEGGTFSGIGVVDNVFEPTLAGIGGPYTITYHFLDANNCSNSIEKQIIVETSVGINDTQHDEPTIHLFPNPNTGIFTLSFDAKKSHQISGRIIDVAGRNVWNQQITSLNGKFEKNFINGELSSGIYLLILEVDQTVYHKKLVVN
jgi:hypothetical protein